MWIKENSSKIWVSSDNIPSKDMEVFYNKAMTHNRNISLAVMASLVPEKVGLPLAGSGVRAFRGFLEYDSLKKTQFFLNDVRKDFIEKIDLSIKENNLSSHNFNIKSTEANIFLLQNKPFDYIDVDPYGSPVPFLMTSIRALRLNGLIALTATDTGALSGAYEGTCLRRYWARPDRKYSSKEIGLRILLRRAILEGASQGILLKPVISYSKDHYFRVYLQAKHSKKEANKAHKLFSFTKEGIGPFYSGLLQNNEFIDLVKSNLEIDSEEYNFLENLQKENFDSIGYVNIHDLASRHKLKNVPNIETVTKILENNNIKFFRTHFSKYGIKSELSREDTEKIILQRV